MLKPALLLCVLVGVATAEVRYKIHPTNGEFVSDPTPRACGPQTRDELFEKVIYPPSDKDKSVHLVTTLIVDAKQAMTLRVKDALWPAHEMMDDNIGKWVYDGRQQRKRMLIGLKPSNKPTRKVISITVIREMDEVMCSERWTGMVEASDD